jgi:hypothetical protein
LVGSSCISLEGMKVMDTLCQGRIEPDLTPYQ